MGILVLENGRREDCLMRLQSCLVAIIVWVSASACSPFSETSLECEFPTLAVGAEIHLALSCAEGIIYEDTEYFVGCAPVHRSRVGDLFVDDGGESRFTGARDVVGMSRRDVFLLETDTRGECRNGKLIATSEGFTRLDARRLRVPAGTANEERLARKRAPWIVPGRNEYPRALKLAAILSENGITVTNRNQFTWRNCDQIQVNDQVDEVWETGARLKSLKSGASYTWPLDAFGGDHHELESLSKYGIDEIRGKPFIIMCRARRGRAFGQDML